MEGLPESYVIKASHGSGEKFLEIIRSRENTNNNKILKKINKSLNKKYGKLSKEYFYDIQKPKILIEKLLLNKKGEVPSDYKFHCFNKKGKFEFYIQVDNDRFSNHTRDVYNKKLEKEPFSMIYETSTKEEPKPKNLDKMIEIAKILSEDFDYIRVDFFHLEEEVYVGEMTLAHESGLGKFYPKTADQDFGKLWEIDFNNKNLYYDNPYREIRE